MATKEIKVYLGEDLKVTLELQTNILLEKVREILLAHINFDYIFLQDDEKTEVPKNEESDLILKDILDGKRLYIKKIIKKRIMLGEKIESKNGIDYYVYPKYEFTEEEKRKSSNFMVIGETGVGKSTWLHCFINYLQGIELEEKYRYYLFDEKKQIEELGNKKQIGDSVTDHPTLYNIKETKVSKNPIRLIDTAGFGDTRGNSYDDTITKDIRHLLTYEINDIHAICFIMKSTETRAHGRLIDIFDKLFSLFGKDIIKNIIVVFTFSDFSDNFVALETLKNKNLPFHKIMGNIDEKPYFQFNSMTYFDTNIKKQKYNFEENKKNFEKLVDQVFNTPKVSLESTREVGRNQEIIEDKIIEISNDINNISCDLEQSMKLKQETEELIKEQQNMRKSENVIEKRKVMKDKKEYEWVDEPLSSGWYVLFCCTHDKICHRNCKGPKEGLHSSEYGCKKIGTFSRKCDNCDCHYSKHSFHNYVKEKKLVTKQVEVEEDWENPEKKASNEQLEKQRAELSEKIEEGNRKAEKLEGEINDNLNIGLNKLKEIVQKEKDLNKIAARPYPDNGYCKKILNEKIKDERFKKILIGILPEIESICSNNTEKNRTIEKIKKDLNKK